MSPASQQSALGPLLTCLDHITRRCFSYVDGGISTSDPRLADVPAEEPSPTPNIGSAAMAVAQASLELIDIAGTVIALVIPTLLTPAAIFWRAIDAVPERRSAPGATPETQPHSECH
jgi:hypothetical protein